MRRQDREMDKEFALGIIDKSDYGSLALIDGSEPYVLPISIARNGEYLYFHSAVKGRKVDLLNKEPYVSIVFVGSVVVADLYGQDELRDIASKDGMKNIVSRVFTTEYESAVVFGSVKKLDEKSKKLEGLRYICEKYTPDKMDYFSDAVDSDLEHVNVYSIKIDKISGKRKKYDKSGQEMKWGRRE